MVHEAKAEERKDELLHTALITWWIYQTIPESKGKRKKSLRQWLQEFGLDDQPRPDPDDVEAIKREAAEVQRQVIDLGKRLGRKGVRSA